MLYLLFGTTLGDRPLKRSDFAVNLNSCLEKINEAIAAGTPLVPMIEEKRELRKLSFAKSRFLRRQICYLLYRLTITKFFAIAC
ncbi:hypothetical protein [Tychonema sp. BBK16]|uniref:hypothetical protein n=1 Tax=Tychonema sp. BBK16 TaxID=2699888 RepID=UPI001F275C55|nr:hypothetical protein [Tychonema sp. BBK16]MCF6373831.1 hypothetical protein [Tychonema sp. BBK16]